MSKQKYTKGQYDTRSNTGKQIDYSARKELQELPSQQERI